MLSFAKGSGIRPTVQAIYHRHSDFILLLILFITFRILALAAYRPGGQVLDFSDFYWYRSFAEVTRQGYYPYDNLVSTYPPIFPVLMIAIYQISVLLPPWEHANLWFTLLLGGFFLLFETGNFILLYLFSLKIQTPQNTPPTTRQTIDPTAAPQSYVEQSRTIQNALRPCWLYAALFIPVYTLTGWFESFPLFFFLLSLYLLIQNRPYLSALFTGIGFMIKLIPLILIPIAVQRLSQKSYYLNLKKRKLTLKKYPDPNHLEAKTFRAGLRYLLISFDLPRIALYSAIFLVTVIIIAWPFYQLNPDLIFASQQITMLRQPWETVWALIDGNYDYGILPLDRRDLNFAEIPPVPSQIPWLGVTAIFGLIYALFYTRPINWAKAKNMLAFAGFTLCLFMLWSKGFSPQWLNWPLFFIALLLPNIRGVIYAAILSLGNIIEANFFFIIFPEEHWLFATTVLIRTFLLIVLTVEFLWLIWPQAVTPRVRKVRAWGLTVFVLLLLLGLIPALAKLGDSYFDLRKRQSPYAATIERLQHETVTGALLLNNHTVYDWFYPYLRQYEYTFYMLDEYDPPTESVETRTTNLLNSIAQQNDVLWIYDHNAALTTPAEETLTVWLNNRPPAHIQDIDGGRLYLFILK